MDNLVKISIQCQDQPKALLTQFLSAFPVHHNNRRPKTQQALRLLGLKAPRRVRRLRDLVVYIFIRFIRRYGFMKCDSKPAREKNDEPKKDFEPYSDADKQTPRGLALILKNAQKGLKHRRPGSLVNEHGRS